MSMGTTQGYIKNDIWVRGCEHNLIRKIVYPEDISEPGEFLVLRCPYRSFSPEGVEASNGCNDIGIELSTCGREYDSFGNYIERNGDEPEFY